VGALVRVAPGLGAVRHARPLGCALRRREVGEERYRWGLVPRRYYLWNKPLILSTGDDAKRYQARQHGDNVKFAPPGRCSCRARRAPRQFVARPSKQGWGVAADDRAIAQDAARFRRGPAPQRERGIVAPAAEGARAGTHFIRHGSRPAGSGGGWFRVARFVAWRATDGGGGEYRTQWRVCSARPGATIGSRPRTWPLRGTSTGSSGGSGGGGAWGA